MSDGVGREDGQLCCHAATSFRYPLRGRFSQRLLLRRERILVVFRAAFRPFESRRDRRFPKNTSTYWALARAVVLSAQSRDSSA
jgi:hypothetical protein